MSFPNVLDRGNEFLNEYPRDACWWNLLSKFTCRTAILASKAIVYLAYKPRIFGLDELDKALERSKIENRGLITVMNHMSVVDDPFFWGILPMRYYRDIDTIRWGFAASNVCFTNTVLAHFFSLGKVLSTERFGAGPFQGSVDAAIRLLSPDDTLDIDFPAPRQPLVAEQIKPPMELKNKLSVVRLKPSWFHVFPEGFVLQLEPPFSNSMRYFHWGISRLLVESTRPPIVLPIFSTGFEKIAPESAAESPLERFMPRNFRHEINVFFGEPIADSIIDNFRSEWRKLVEKYHDPKNPFDLSEQLKNGEEAKELRSRIAATLREAVADVRHKIAQFPVEDPRFKLPEFWKQYTLTEGASAPDVKFIGKNWAIRRLQKFLQEDFDKQVQQERNKEDKP